MFFTRFVDTGWVIIRFVQWSSRGGEKRGRESFVGLKNRVERLFELTRGGQWVLKTIFSLRKMTNMFDLNIQLHLTSHLIVCCASHVEMMSRKKIPSKKKGKCRIEGRCGPHVKKLNQVDVGKKRTKRSGQK